MSQPVVVAKNISVHKKKHVLFEDVSFEIQPGTVCGLLGPSGAGKTTLMRLLVGLQAATAGKAVVLGNLAGSKQNRRRIGYVTQSPSIYLDLTVTQNLAYFAALVGADKKAVREVLAKVRLEPQAKQLVATLSGGQRTRASLAVALLGDPQILIMDEPTVGLDPLLRRDLWELFASMAKAGKTLLVSSHVMDEAAHCQQLLLLREGKLLWSTSQTELLKATGLGSVEEAFIRLVKGKK